MKWIIITLALSLLLIGCGSNKLKVEQTLHDVQLPDEKEIKNVAEELKEEPEEKQVPSLITEDEYVVIDNFCHKFIDDDTISAIKQIRKLPALAIAERHNLLNPNSGIESCQYLIPKPEDLKCTKADLEPPFVARCATSIMQISFQCGDVGGRTPVDSLEFMAGEPFPAGDKTLIDVPRGNANIAKDKCLISVLVFKNKEAGLDQVQKALTSVVKLIDSKHEGRKVAATGAGLA